MKSNRTFTSTLHSLKRLMFYSLSNSFVNIRFPASLILVIAVNIQSGLSQNRQSELDNYRKKYYEDYVNHDRAPYLIEDTIHLDFYPLDTSYIFTGVFQPSESQDTLKMMLYSGDFRMYIKSGYIQFTAMGKAQKLALYQDRRFIRHPVYKNNLFLPFKDLTNGTTTYGGGRYMEINKLDIEDQKVELNFNLAYNPWCVYSDGYHCPIPPSENHLNISIKAGEKDYKKPYDD